MNITMKSDPNDGGIQGANHLMRNDLVSVTSQARELMRKMQKRTDSPPKETRRLLDKYGRL